MSTEKKLSDELRDAAEMTRGWSEGVYSNQLDPWADRARALEERVAELESINSSNVRNFRNLLTDAESERDEANARAEAAEAEVARLRMIRATGAVEKVANERDALRAKLAAVRAECMKDVTWCDEHGGWPSVDARLVVNILDKGDSK